MKERDPSALKGGGRRGGGESRKFFTVGGNVRGDKAILDLWRFLKGGRLF